MRRTVVSVLLMGGILSAAVGASAWLVMTRPAAPRTEERPPPPLVEVEAVRVVTVRPEFVGYGTVRADARATLTAQVSGEVLPREERLRAGMAVEAGEVLVRIDPREYAARVAHFEALVAASEASLREVEEQIAGLERQLALAKREVEVNESEYRRVADLYERNLAADREFNFARLAWVQARRRVEEVQTQIAALGSRREALAAQIAANRAELEQARVNLERCTVRAPFSGVVQEVYVQPGEKVGVGQQLVSLVNLGVVEVPIRLPASAYPEVGGEAACRLNAESMPQVRWEGRVVRRSPVVDEQTRTFVAYVLVDNSEQSVPLIPGMFVRAVVSGVPLKNVLAVRRSAIVDGAVFVAEREVARRRPIRIERYVGDHAVVAGGLRAGERVILTNLDDLEDGQRVRTSERVSDGGRGGPSRTARLD